MKSFFKKLSLVMALAMVVSLVAPAGVAANAAETLGIVAQEDTTWTALETDELEVGAVQDYKFAGAPENWKEFTWTWTTSDEAVATVNEKNGEVTAVADGVVTITVSNEDASYVGSIEITVGEPEADTAFEVKQTTANTVEIVFADAKNATADIIVEKLIKTTSGDVTGIVWPVNTTTVNDGKATVTTWVDFGTGDYRFTANGESVEKLMAVGNPAFAVITYKDAYAYADNENSPIKPEISVYDEAGVKLTGYNNWYFELLNADADAYLESDGTLYLWNVGARAQMKATLTYVVGTEPKTIECPVDVTCVPKPDYTVNSYLEKYAIVAPNTEADKIAWGKTDVIIDDGTYTVAGIIKDSDNKELTFADLGAKGYKVTFESSNPSIALVGAGGEVIGVNAGNAYVLVTLYKKADKDINMGVIAAIPVNVVAAKKATVVTLDKTVATLLTEGDFTTIEVTATTKNQYGGEDKTDYITSVSAKDSNGNTYSNSETKDSNTKVVEITGSKFTIDAKDLHKAEVNSLTFTVTMKSGLKTTFVLNLKRLPAESDKINETFALVVNGAKILENETAKVEVVSAWAGNSLSKISFYYGKPADSVIEKDDLYVTITGPDGNELDTKTGTHSALEFNAVEATSTATAGAIKTMTAGKYVVKLNRVTQCIEADGKVIVQTVVCDTEVFEITDNLHGVTDFDVEANTYTDIDNPINKSNVTLKVNGVEWSESNVAVGKVTKKTLDGSVYVYGFEVKIPYGDKGAYYTVYVPVNEIFTATK